MRIEYTVGSPSINGFYFREAPDLVFAATGPPAVAAVNPLWHDNYHMLPSYYAAGVLLRKDRLHETAAAMENRFSSGVEEYRVWYERKFPFRHHRTQPVSPRIDDIAPFSPGVPWEVEP